MAEPHPPDYAGIREAIAHAEEPAATHVATNGAGRPVIDGATGGVILEVDGEAAVLVERTTFTPGPEAPRLIDVDLDVLVHDFNMLDRQRDDAKARKKAAAAEVKGLTERIDPILYELRRRDDEANRPPEIEQELPFDASGEAEEPGDDE